MKRVWITMSFPLPTHIGLHKAVTVVVPAFMEFIKDLTGSYPKTIKTEMR